MGAPSRVGTIQGYNNYDDDVLHMELTLNQDVYVYKETEYQLINRTGDFMKAGKKSFLEIFSDYKKNIEGYLKSNNLNFNKQDDVEKLFQFCIGRE